MRRSVATFPKRTEAEVAQGLLASAGIAAWVAADDAGGAYGLTNRHSRALRLVVPALE